MRPSPNIMDKMSLSAGSDVALALGVVAILLIMIIPIPTALLDILLTFSITLAIIVLLMVMYIIKPLDFSVFPSLLLIATLFRLSLNMASTRLILLHGNEGLLAAGKVIKSFGSFVVGGNYVVGFVVFLILVVVNFIVITKGAGRIAEVAARFTLDAMPGRQMSIDADLNAGLIDDKEARERRATIAREADFYGAMDGASKFVRGDAIAGVVITLINIIGGFIIGVTQQKMNLYAAAQTYTLLTIGDGLVTQIPALIISSAAGIMVSKAASEASLGKDFAEQFALEPRAIGIAAGIVFVFGLIPGLPHIPFILLSVLVGSFAALARNMKRKALGEKTSGEQTLPSRGPEAVEALLPLDILELEIGYGLIPLVDEQQNGELLERIRAIRRQFAVEMGIIVPPIHVRDNLRLKPGGYAIVIKGIRVAEGELMIGHCLAMDPGDVKKKVNGIPTKEPAFGLPALWIPEKKKEEAQFSGYTVVDLPTVVSTHLTEVIKSHAPELLGRQEVQKLLDTLAIHHPKVIEELTPILSLGATQKVLQNLLRERVSIRDILTIAETLADYASAVKDSDLLTEYVRQRLKRSIVKPYLTEDGVLPLLTIDQDIEEIISKGIDQTDYGYRLTLEPNLAQKILASISNSVQGIIPMNYHPICLTSPLIRRHLRQLVERFMPHLVILSHSELPDDIKIKSLRVVSLKAVSIENAR